MVSDEVLLLVNIEVAIILKVESFAGRNFGGDKLSRTAMVKIKFRRYKLSRLASIFALFLCFRAVFRIF